MTKNNFRWNKEFANIMHFDFGYNDIFICNDLFMKGYKEL